MVTAACSVLVGCGMGDLRSGNPAPTRPAEPTASETAVVFPQLGAAELVGLLRTEAENPGTAETCGPGEVEAYLWLFSAHLGSRDTYLVVRNSSERPCEVSGAPGIGGLGQDGGIYDGHADAGVDPRADGKAVLLQPGEEAASFVGWSYAAGAYDERIVLLAFQLAGGQTPVPVEAQVSMRGVDWTQGDWGDPTDAKLRDREDRLLDIAVCSKLHATAFFPIAELGFADRPEPVPGRVGRAPADASASGQSPDPEVVGSSGCGAY